MNKTIVYSLCAAVLAGCGPAHRNGADPAHGFATAGTGLGQLVLAPFMVVAGLLEGLAALPMFLGAGLHELNREMVAANARVTLDDVYRDAYGARLEDVAASGDTGVVFREMRSVTVHFQSMLRLQGVADADRYLLTAVRTADRDGYTLYAVVRRFPGPVTVHDGPGGTLVRQLNLVDLDYYRPYARDANGRVLDEVIDWAGVPRSAIATQKGQAILLNLAANAVLNDKASPDYWLIEKRWMAGDYRMIAETRQQALRVRMGIG